MRRTAAALAILMVGALVLAVPQASAAAGRTYPTHTRIAATTAWVGEVWNGSQADGSQVCSTYDGQWAKRWSGKDNGAKAPGGTDCAGAPLGGCDGIPSGSGLNFKCATERRTSANGYWPTSAQVTPQENPFYLDVPYDDLNNSAAYRDRATVIPWANDPGYAGQAKNTAFSYMKNRWMKLTRAGQTCYAQNQDAGPALYNDRAYVFGSTDARPASREFGGAGMDVSPAVTGCLNLPDIDGISPKDITWQWVDAVDVPPGPWTRVVTYSQVNGATGSAAYIASITPGGVVPPVKTSPPAPPTSSTAAPAEATSSSPTSSSSTPTEPPSCR